MITDRIQNILNNENSVIRNKIFERINNFKYLEKNQGNALMKLEKNLRKKLIIYGRV